MRALATCTEPSELPQFPFLFGGTFIEGFSKSFSPGIQVHRFPFLFGGTFIEGQDMKLLVKAVVNISLPFRRDFH